jgi:hypothetical protein
MDSRPVLAELPNVAPEAFRSRPAQWQYLPATFSPLIHPVSERADGDALFWVACSQIANAS